MEFKDKRNLSINIPCRWVRAKYPLDFRSQEEIDKTRFRSVMKMEGFTPQPGMNKDEMFEAAAEFARNRGTRTPEGFIIAVFDSIIYFEVDEYHGWLENSSFDQVHELLKRRFQPKELGDQSSMNASNDLP